MLFVRIHVKTHKGFALIFNRLPRLPYIKVTIYKVCLVNVPVKGYEFTQAFNK